MLHSINRLLSGWPQYLSRKWRHFLIIPPTQWSSSPFQPTAANQRPAVPFPGRCFDTLADSRWHRVDSCHDLVTTSRIICGAKCPMLQKKTSREITIKRKGSGCNVYVYMSSVCVCVCHRWCIIMHISWITIDLNRMNLDPYTETVCIQALPAFKMLPNMTSISPAMTERGPTRILSLERRPKITQDRFLYCPPPTHNSRLQQNLGQYNAAWK